MHIWHLLNDLKTKMIQRKELVARTRIEMSGEMYNYVGTVF